MSDAAPPPTEAPTRCGFIALLGEPNAGKSTLVNALVGSKVSIVSRKAQTTRALVRGVVMEGAAQIVLIDTPGLFAPRRRLDRAMMTAAWTGAGDADRLLVLIDAKRAEEMAPELVGKIAALPQNKDLVLTKVDLVPREELLPLSARLNELARFERTFMVSATTGSGVADVRRHLAAVAPPGPWHYLPDELSDLPARMLAAEITREAVFERLHDEIPYESTVETERYEERRDGSIRIEQTIYVMREGQRKIVLGRDGATIKAVSMAARKELQHLFETPVHLFLTVVVKEEWTDQPERYERMGLEFPKGR